MKFNEALLIVNEAVMKNYPTAAFYEAQAEMIPTDDNQYDGTINPQMFKVVYSIFMKGRTVIATFNDKNEVVMETINEPWLEDIYMTPYISMNVELAIELLNEKFGKNVLKEGNVTLRHQLYPNEGEPRYFFGSIRHLHTVNVYTGEIDKPLDGFSKEKEESILGKLIEKIKNFFSPKK